MSLTRKEIADQYIDDTLKPEYRDRLVSGLESAIKHREEISMGKMFDAVINDMKDCSGSTQEADSLYWKDLKQEFIDSNI